MCATLDLELSRSPSPLNTPGQVYEYGDGIPAAATCTSTHPQVSECGLKEGVD